MRPRDRHIYLVNLYNSCDDFPFPDCFISSAGMVLTSGFWGCAMAITISPDSCFWVIGAIWINGSELLDLACSMFEFDKSSR